MAWGNLAAIESLPGPDAAKKLPTDWWVNVRISFPAAAGSIYMDFSHGVAQVGRTNVSPVQSGIIAASDFTLQSPVMRGARDVIPRMSITFLNQPVTAAWAILHPSVPWPFSQPMPRLSDVLTAYVYSALTLGVELSLKTSETQLELRLFSGRIDQIETASDELITVSVVQDRRWDDVIPRHYAADKTTGSVTRSGVPIGLHYGRWGGQGQDLAGRKLGFSPYGTNDQSGRCGGFRSPVPLIELDTGEFNTDYAREYHVSRYFPPDENFAFLASEDWSLYIATGVGLARLHYDNSPTWNGWIVSRDPADSDLPPAGECKARLHVDGEADLRLAPDAATVPGLWDDYSSDSFANLGDGKAETWVNVPITTVGANQTFVWNTSQALGAISDIQLVVELWADSVGSFTPQIDMELRYGDGAGEVVTDTFTPTQGDLMYPNVYRAVLACGAALNPTLNRAYLWDFTYHIGADETDRRGMTAEITVDRSDGGSQTVNYYVRNVYLLVTYKAFMRLVDLQVGLVPHPSRTQKDADGDPKWYTAQISKTYEEIRNARFNVFADSRGHLDEATGRYTGFTHGTIENPASMIAHMVEKFGVRPGAAGQPNVLWTTGDNLNLSELRDFLDDSIDWLTQGAISGYRAHWLVDEQKTIMENAFELARESRLQLELFSNVSSRESIGAWQPLPANYGPRSLYDFTDSMWRGDADLRLDASRILELAIGQTPITSVINDLTINYAFDYVTGSYARSMRVNAEGYTGGPDPNADYATDLTLTGPYTDVTACFQSFAMYRQAFPRTINLRSVYRYWEAALIRHLLVNLWKWQRPMLTMRVMRDAIDITPGTRFRLHENVGPKFNLYYPDALVHGSITAAPGTLTQDWSELWWRATRVIWSPSAPPVATITALWDV